MHIHLWIAIPVKPGTDCELIVWIANRDDKGGNDATRNLHYLSDQHREVGAKLVPPQTQGL